MTVPKILENNVSQIKKKKKWYTYESEYKRKM